MEVQRVVNVIDPQNYILKVLVLIVLNTFQDALARKDKIK